MFPVNTILAWIINDYREQGNIIITNLLLPLGHISNIKMTPGPSLASILEPSKYMIQLRMRAISLSAMAWLR